MKLHEMHLDRVDYSRNLGFYDFKARLNYQGRPVIKFELKIKSGKIVNADMTEVGIKEDVAKVKEIAEVIYENITKEVPIYGKSITFYYTASLDLLLMYLYDIYAYEELLSGFRGIEISNTRFFVYKLNEGEGKNYDPFDYRSVAQIKPRKEMRMSSIGVLDDVTEEEAIKRVSNKEGVRTLDIVASILGRGKLPDNITIQQYYSIYL